MWRSDKEGEEQEKDFKKNYPQYEYKQLNTGPL